MERVDTDLGCSERMERVRERTIREEQSNDRGTDQQRTTLAELLKPVRVGGAR